MPHMYDLHISYDENTDRILLHSDKGFEPPHAHNRTEEVIRAYEKYMGMPAGMINIPKRKARTK